MSAKITITIPEWLDRICTWPVMEYLNRKYGYPFRKIDLGEGEWTMLDAGDYYRLRDLKWYLSGNGTKLYAARNIKTGPARTKIVRMHREIMNAPRGLLVDHRNCDGLDNRRDNLRLATSSQNACNRQKKKSKASSRFRGVYYEKRSRKWIAVIYCRGKRIWIGTFETEVEVARAYPPVAFLPPKWGYAKLRESKTPNIGTPLRFARGTPPRPTQQNWTSLRFAKRDSAALRKTGLRTRRRPPPSPKARLRYATQHFASQKRRGGRRNITGNLPASTFQKKLLYPESEAARSKDPAKLP